MLQVRVLPGLLVFTADAQRRLAGSAVCVPAGRGGRKGETMKKIIRFFKESYAELKKVTWPSREEVVSSTKVVLVSVILIALALGLVDFLIFRGIDLVF